MSDIEVYEYVFSRIAGGQSIALIVSPEAEKSEILQQLNRQYRNWLPDTEHWCLFIFLPTNLGQMTYLPVFGKGFGKSLLKNPWTNPGLRLLNN